MIIRYRTFMNSAMSQHGDLKLSKGALLSDVLTALELTDHLEMAQEQVILLVNGQSVTPNHCLTEGDDVLILQSMMGG